ncbi:MAG: NUDIX hydrolase [Pseudonocardiales bacterium]|nr:NUDIX hydrolase [Pseudonocardiales bacterium]PZS30799.1 MAG: NUDIX hydrolase [Pseudonocardiales bacterium]
MRVARVAVTAAVVVAAAGAVGAMRAATRLDRLHVRTDAAWAALDAALGSRARAVMGVDAMGVDGGSAALRGAADAALLAGLDPALRTAGRWAHRAGLAVREDVENELGRVLAVLDRGGLESACADRLADAEQRAMIARRVYNDAVRDTLALRSHRMVRWLRLAGTAALPRYFEIAEPALAGYGLELDGAGA